MIDRTLPQWPTIKWPVTMTAMTRNGTVKCSGVEVTMEDMIYPEFTSYISIAPVTGKGNVANAYIQIPATHIDELITLLTEARDKLTKCPQTK